MTEPAEQLLTTEEAAKRLAVSPSGLRKLVAKGVVPRVKLGKSVRYDVADLRRVIAESKGGSKA